MGVRVNVYFSHDLLGDADDLPDQAIARLQQTLPAARAIDSYWNKRQPEVSSVQRWEKWPVSPRDRIVRRIEGPGTLLLSLTPNGAILSAGARWLGFLTIDPLRRVYLTAIEAVGHSLHAQIMAICADSQETALEVFLGGGAQEDCIAELQRVCGAPQPTASEIAQDLAERDPARMWFLERLAD
ncbi:MAG TPA: hypothetical protein VF669_04230 [Tepidisphaeraceae bacterium]